MTGTGSWQRIPADLRPFTLRLPVDLFERVRAAAAASGRSFNGQVEWALYSHMARLEASSRSKARHTCMLHLPQPLIDAVRAEAARSGRSINAEIEVALGRALARAEAVPRDSPAPSAPDRAALLAARRGYQVRLPHDVFAQVCAEAERHGRSINREITAALYSYIAREEARLSAGRPDTGAAWGTRTRRL